MWAGRGNLQCRNVTRHGIASPLDTGRNPDKYPIGVRAGRSDTHGGWNLRRTVATATYGLCRQLCVLHVVEILPRWNECQRTGAASRSEGMLRTARKQRGQENVV